MQEVTGSSPVSPKLFNKVKMKKLILSNGNQIEVSEDKTYEDVIKKNLPKKLLHTLAVSINGKAQDLKQEILEEGELQILTFQDEEGKEIFWHSSAHVLAQAIKRLYPQAQLTVGPVIKSGPGFFYYDIFLEEKITEEDFPRLEKEMCKIVSEKLPVSRHVYERSEAIQEFKEMGENFKAEIISDIPEQEKITIYKQGEFQDLCRGPHISSTEKLGFLKLTAVSGAYWKGDPKAPMLQRIYGVSFPTEKELKSYLYQIEEAKKRDHRKLGKELDLFSFQEEGPGFPFYHPKGTVLFSLLADYIKKECVKRNYQEIKTPLILSDELWIQSGHYENFKENMYFTEIEEKGFAIKPMNCPGHNLIYKSNPKSYRDLPIRLAELGLVHRHELSGVLHGLFRARSFTQDDAHIYCTPEQLTEEIEAAINFTKDIYSKFGFEGLDVYVATRPEKSLGADDIWEKATSSLTTSLEKVNLNYKIKGGEGAFYGPKIEFNIQDSLGRNWQCGTIQVDFSMPERFNLEYIDSDNQKRPPVMVHRAILGSLERFMGILIEHYAGKLPLWLSPEQIRILTVSSKQDNYAKEVYKNLLDGGFRVSLDLRNEKIGYKIREWNQKKVNYAIVLGSKEEEERTIAFRKRGEKATKTSNIENFKLELID